ncbi:hypothetical protein GCM10010398_04360 [Streptomyces fimbriatus]
MTEASGKRWPAGPWVPKAVPSARTTPAAAVGTGQFSINARLFSDMPSSLSVRGTVPAEGPDPGPRPDGAFRRSRRACLPGVHSSVLAWGP